MEGLTNEQVREQLYAMQRVVRYRADADFNVLGYCTQARFLINCGIGPLLDAATLPVRAQAQRLLLEHEMGELFKVIGLHKGEPWQAIGFAQGDRTHTL